MQCQYGLDHGRWGLMQGVASVKSGYLELHEHPRRVVGGDIGAHGIDARLVEGRPQLASVACARKETGLRG